MKGLKEAQDALSTVTTLLLAPGENSISSGKTFYAHFLMKMNVIWDNKRVPTAGVSVTDKINLYINPEFFNSLNARQQMELLEHEIEHIVYLHPLRSKDYIGEGLNHNTHKLFNISSDAGINENKPHLTKDLGVTFKRLNDELQKMGSKDRVGPHLSSEQTYEVLKNNQVEQDGPGMQTSDDHSTWAESTDNQEVAKGIIQQTANQAQAATGAGNMPENMLRQISELNKSDIRWERLFRQKVTSATKFIFERTRNRRNRRYGVVQPGRKKKQQLKVAVLGDESGSMCDEAVAQAYAEVDAMSEAGADVYYVSMDSEASEPVKYEPRKKLQRTRCGGTIYSPGLEMSKKIKPDLIVVIGDMDAADTPTDPGIPVIWCVIGNQNPPGNFGSIIRVEVERGR